MMMRINIRDTQRPAAPCYSDVSQAQGASGPVDVDAP